MTVNSSVSQEMEKGEGIPVAAASQSAPSFRQESRKVATGSTTEITSDTEGTWSDTNKAAAVAGGVIGLLVGGPAIGLAAGISTGYATSMQGPAGDIARATGDFAIGVGESAQRIDEKHHVTDKARESIMSAWNKVQGSEEKSNAVDRMSEYFRSAGDKVLECERSSHIMENVLSGIADAATMLKEKLKQVEASVPPQSESDKEDLSK